MHLDAFLSARLQHMERVLAGREWLLRMETATTQIQTCE